MKTVSQIVEEIEKRMLLQIEAANTSKWMISEHQCNPYEKYFWLFEAGNGGRGE